MTTIQHKILYSVGCHFPHFYHLETIEDLDNIFCMQITLKNEIQYCVIMRLLLCIVLHLSLENISS